MFVLLIPGIAYSVFRLLIAEMLRKIPRAVRGHGHHAHVLCLARGWWEGCTLYTEQFNHICGVDRDLSTNELQGCHLRVDAIPFFSVVIKLYDDAQCDPSETPPGLMFKRQVGNDESGPTCLYMSAGCRNFCHCQHVMPSCSSIAVV